MPIIEAPKFGRGNAKLGDNVLTLSLPSGFTCPGALQCLAKADRDTGRITDGGRQEFRCFEASAESRWRSVRDHRWRNFDILRKLDASAMATALLHGLFAARQLKSTHVRWFTGGDFFSTDMRDAVMECARSTPDLIHYAYTKSLPFFVPWVATDDGGFPLPRPKPMPPNLFITASWGGRFDHLITEARFPRTACVVHTIAEAEAAGLEIDTTDQLAWQEKPTHFCHLTHGSQPAGSRASTELSARRRRGEFAGYSGKSRVREPQLAG